MDETLKSMSHAARSSWTTLPPPAKRAHLTISELFSDAVGERMRVGHIPTDMDDKWFVVFEDGWLNFYRSWTGCHIYALRLDGSPVGVRVVDGWVSRDRDQYRSPGVDHDRRTVVRLVHRYFGE